MKEFITRTITAFFLIIAAYFVIKFVPATWFSLLLFVMISAGAHELVKLAQPATYSMSIIFLSGLIIALSFTRGTPELAPGLILILLINGLFFLFAIRKKEELDFFIKDIGVHFLTVFYLYFPLYFLFQL
ncbi:MAG: hypothetical protein GY757_07685, partial [bacterium]|nr:hypothetical protein [bacterium]